MSWFYLRKYDILNEFTETRIYCGFRENMIQVANRPCDEVALEWPICLRLESLIQDVTTFDLLDVSNES